jgi:hypothetical protein
MELKFSETGIPYIELMPNHNIIFSETTRSSQGYKYLCYSGSTVSEIVSAGKPSKSKAKTKRKIKAKNKSVKVKEVVNFITDMKLSKIKKKLVKNTPFSPITQSYLRKTLSKLIDEDGFFPPSKLEILRLELERTNGEDSDSWNNDPTATESYDD